MSPEPYKNPRSVEMAIREAVRAMHAADPAVSPAASSTSPCSRSPVQRDRASSNSRRSTHWRASYAGFAFDDRDAFVLKGGVLLAAFDARRPTRDADPLALDLDNDRANVEAKIGSIASIDVADGLALDVASVTSEVIRNEAEYSGIRVNLNYALATVYVRIGIDVNVGDPVHPMPQRITVPVLLADDVTLLGYPMAAVIAEKAVTAMQRGVANTRWRDWADIHVLSSRHAFDSDELAGACTAVAAHRGTEVVLIAALLPDYPKIAQAKWVAWRRRPDVVDGLPESFADVLRAVSDFVDPLLGELTARSVWDPMSRTWQP